MKTVGPDAMVINIPGAWDYEELQGCCCADIYFVVTADTEDVPKLLKFIDRIYPQSTLIHTRSGAVTV